MNWQEGIVYLVVALAALVSAKGGKLTRTGALCGWLVASLIFLGAHYTGLAMLAAFFIMGTLATSWGMSQKERLGIAKKSDSKRTAGQVLANGGFAAIAGLCMYIFPTQNILFALMMAASLSSAAADTISSELGMLYGKRTFNILTFKKDRRGENGVVSIEGTLFGMAASAVIAVIYSIGYDFNVYTIWIILAGTIGNITDSILGATLERQAYLNNNAVNFLNTLTAALCIWISYGLY